MKKLHVYAQREWHEESFIAGNREALEDLVMAIQEALVTGQAKTDASCADGEGFEAYVVCVEDDLFDELVLPYTSEFAQQNLSKGTPVYKLVKKP